MTRYRTLQRCAVRAQPSNFAPELRRLGRNHDFIGWPHADAAWVVRMLGGFVRHTAVVEVRT